VKRFRSRPLHPWQCSSASKQCKADGGQSHEEVHFRCSDRHRRYLGHRVRSIPPGPTNTADGGWGSQLVDSGKRDGTRLVDHSRTRTHVVRGVRDPWKQWAGSARATVSQRSLPPFILVLLCVGLNHPRRIGSRSHKPWGWFSARHCVSRSLPPFILLLLCVGLNHPRRWRQKLTIVPITATVIPIPTRTPQPVF
jgi:hypothetical protein